MTKIIQIPITNKKGLIVNIIDYEVDFIGQIGSKSGKPYASETSDNDYYVVLTPVTNLNTVLQISSLRWTWDINKRDILKPIVDQIVRHYGEILPPDFKIEDIKIDTINHLFKQITAQGLEPYDKLYTTKIFYISERYKWLKNEIKSDNPFINTFTFEKTVRGHAHAYFKRNQPERALYTFLKYNEIVRYYNVSRGIFGYQIPLHGNAQKIYNRFKIMGFNKIHENIGLNKFTKHHKLDNNRVNYLLTQWYNF